MHGGLVRPQRSRAHKLSATLLGAHADSSMRTIHPLWTFPAMSRLDSGSDTLRVLPTAGPRGLWREPDGFSVLTTGPHLPGDARSLPRSPGHSRGRPGPAPWNPLLPGGG